MEPNQELQQTINNLLHFILTSLTTTTTTTQTTTTTTTTTGTAKTTQTIDPTTLQQLSLAFSIQIYQTINQFIQANHHQQQPEQQEKPLQETNTLQKQHPIAQQKPQQQQNQNNPSTTSIHRSQSEPSQSVKSNHVTLKPISPQEHPHPSSSILPSSTLENTYQSPNHDINQDPPRASEPNTNYTEFDQDPISEELRVCIQSEIENGVNELASQFDESLQEAKHQLVSINRSLLESKLGKKADPDPDPSLAPGPISKIQVGSIAEKLKFQFESHLIDCYQDYLNRFTYAIGYTKLGDTPLDLKDTQQLQILNPQIKLSNHPQNSSAPENHQSVDQQVQKMITEKFDKYRVELEKQAVQFRNQVLDHINQHTEASLNEINAIIDQIEQILVREKDELTKIKHQNDGLGDRMNQLETQLGDETNPILRRSNVLKSLGLIQSNNTESNDLQTLNRGIFLTKLNDHLTINLRQISIKNDTVDLDRMIKTGQFINPADCQESDRPPCPALHSGQDPDGDEEFIDKLIVKLLMRINQTLSYDVEDDGDPRHHHHHHQSHDQTMCIDQQSGPPNETKPNPDSQNEARKRHQDRDGDEEEGTRMEAEADRAASPDGQPIHAEDDGQKLTAHHPLSMVDNLKQIHWVLDRFFELNFKKFVWPKFAPLACELENYLISQQV